MTSKETKEKVAKIHRGYIEEYMFGSLRNLPPSEGFRVYVEDMETITVNPKHDREVKNNIIKIHDNYLGFCENYKGCIGCPYQRVGASMGACFKNYIDDHIEVVTFETMMSKALIGLGAVIAGILVGIWLRRYW